MSTAKPPSAVSHLTLPVADLEQAERFYVELLGLTLVRRIDRETFARLLPERVHELDHANSPLHVELRCGALELHLFEQGHAVARELRPHPHLAFEVEAGDLDDHAARLRACGVPVDGPRRLGPPGQASIYFADPFGNLLELTTGDYAGPVTIGPPQLASLAYTEWSLGR